MDTKKKILILGAAALMVLGGVMVASATEQGKTGFFGRGCMRGGVNMHTLPGNMTALESLGLPENATRQQVSDALWQKELKDLGLTEDSTLREYRQALEARMEANHEVGAQKMRERLGLPANATMEETRDAMGRWRRENADLLPGKGRTPGDGMWGGMGFGRWRQ